MLQLAMMASGHHERSLARLMPENHVFPFKDLSLSPLGAQHLEGVKGNSVLEVAWMEEGPRL
jgi:hypothetical protein